MSETRPKGPVDETTAPRYAGPATFARLPQIDEVAEAGDIGVPLGADIVEVRSSYDQVPCNAVCGRAADR